MTSARIIRFFFINVFKCLFRLSEYYYLCYVDEFCYLGIKINNYFNDNNEKTSVQKPIYLQDPILLYENKIIIHKILKYLFLKHLMLLLMVLVFGVTSLRMFLIFL